MNQNYHNYKKALLDSFANPNYIKLQLLAINNHRRKLDEIENNLKSSDEKLILKTTAAFDFFNLLLYYIEEKPEEYVSILEETIFIIRPSFDIYKETR